MKGEFTNGASCKLDGDFEEEVTKCAKCHDESKKMVGAKCPLGLTRWQSLVALTSMILV